MAEVKVGKKRIPAILLFSRLGFLVSLTASLPYWWIANHPETELNIVWTIYLVSIYAIFEYLYALFIKRGINLSFAFPLLLSVYLLNLVSMIFNGQEVLPILNRAEHFTSFVLLTYVIWIFFTKYLPQAVWKEHPYYTSILVFSVASAMGVINEIIELFIDVVFKTKLIGNGLDTSIDLLMNTFGATLFLLIRLFYGKWEEKK